jgi:hypothetical protein
VDPHRRAELRSLAYHRAIAERIATDGDIVARARARVAAWQRTGEVHAHWVETWQRLLALPTEQLRALLAADTEEMIAARQSTPFAGALTARERWQLWRSVSP